MKKFIFSFLMVFTTIFGANAQTAIETAKLFDNTYVGAGIGVTTPLDFNSVFPLNTAFGVKFGKEFTPIVGVELEAAAVFNDNHFGDIKTFIKATNIGVNGVVNLSNLFCGYKGTPRNTEFKANVGLGWLHGYDVRYNGLTAKTGVDVQFNLGKTKAHSLVITPAIYWNLSHTNGVKFDKRGAQFAVAVTYLYHFKTSNGTRHFKTYDVGALTTEIDRLNSELAKKPKEVVVEKVIVKRITDTNTQTVLNEVTVYFAQNEYVLTPESKAKLDAVKGKVKVSGYASPEGSEEYNKELSQKRADVVADYLKGRGVTVTEAVGYGATGNTSNRVANVTVQ